MIYKSNRLCSRSRALLALITGRSGSVFSDCDFHAVTCPLRACPLKFEKIVEFKICEKDQEQQPEETDQGDSLGLVKYAYFFSLLSSVCAISRSSCAVGI